MNWKQALLDGLRSYASELVAVVRQKEGGGRQTYHVLPGDTRQHNEDRGTNAKYPLHQALHDRHPDYSGTFRFQQSKGPLTVHAHPLHMLAHVNAATEKGWSAPHLVKHLNKHLSDTSYLPVASGLHEFNASLITNSLRRVDNPELQAELARYTMMHPAAPRNERAAYAALPTLSAAHSSLMALVQHHESLGAAMFAPSFSKIVNTYGNSSAEPTLSGPSVYLPAGYPGIGGIDNFTSVPIFSTLSGGQHDDAGFMNFSPAEPRSAYPSSPPSDLGKAVNPNQMRKVQIAKLSLRPAKQVVT